MTTQHAKDPQKLAKALSETAGWDAAQTGSGLAGFMTTPTLAKNVTLLTPEQLAAELASARGQGTDTPG